MTRNQWAVIGEILLWLAGGIKLGMIVSAIIAFSTLPASGGDKPPLRLEPSETDSPAGNAAPSPIGEFREDGTKPKHAPAGSQGFAEASSPVVTIYTMSGCQPCQQVHSDAAQGLLRGFDVRFRSRERDEVPSWVRWYPCFHWRSSDGRSYVYPRQDGSELDPPSFSGTSEFLRQYASTNPQSVSLPLTGSPIGDQAKKFFPDGTRIVIEPPQPIRETLDDGTRVSYSRITGRVNYEAGQPRLTLEAPLPTVAVRKWLIRRSWGLEFGATVNGAKLEDSQPPSIQIETSRGKFRVELKEVP